MIYVVKEGVIMYYERYSKGVIEPFAIEAIAKSFNSKYAEYRQPTNTDNFDFIICM